MYKLLVKSQNFSDMCNRRKRSTPPMNIQSKHGLTFCIDTGDVPTDALLLVPGGVYDDACKTVLESLACLELVVE